MKSLKSPPGPQNSPGPDLIDDPRRPHRGSDSGPHLLQCDSIKDLSPGGRRLHWDLVDPCGVCVRGGSVVWTAVKRPD